MRNNNPVSGTGSTNGLKLPMYFTNPVNSVQWQEQHAAASSICSSGQYALVRAPDALYVARLYVAILQYLHRTSCKPGQHEPDERILAIRIAWGKQLQNPVCIVRRQALESMQCCA